MPKHSRKLLVAAALCWVAPASAGYHEGQADACSMSKTTSAPPSGALTHVPLLQSDRAALLP